MSEIVTWIRKNAVSSRSVIVCGGKSRCLVLFISFLLYLKAVRFRSVSVNECPWTKKQDLSLVTAEGIKAKGTEGALLSWGWGGADMAGSLHFSLTCLCWRGTRQFLAIDVCGTLERGKGAHGVTAWSTAWQASGAYVLGPRVYGGRSTVGDWVQ